MTVLVVLEILPPTQRDFDISNESDLYTAILNQHKSNNKNGKEFSSYISEIFMNNWNNSIHSIDGRRI